MALDSYYTKEVINRLTYELDRRVSILEAQDASGIPPTPVPSGLEDYVQKETFERSIYALDRRLSLLEKEGMALAGKYFEDFIDQQVLTITHNLETSNVLVHVYRGASMIIPESIEIKNDNIVEITMAQSISGKVVIIA